MILEEMARENKKGAITAQVTYEANGMSFNPPESEFQECFRKILNEM